MKNALVVMMMLTATAYAGKSTGAERTVTICVVDGQDDVTSHAQDIARQIFAGIGVNVEWHNGVRFCQANAAHAIFVNYSHDTPKDRNPGALASARPYEGVHFEVFYDRMMEYRSDIARTRVLGHVLAHEIAHILQAIARHSTTGVMKPFWSDLDIHQMQIIPLRFTELDAELIHDGIAKRNTNEVAQRVKSNAE